MATKSKRLLRKERRHSERAAANCDLNFRAFRVRAKTADETKRTVDASITTETPVNEWDWMRGEIVPRVLLTEGATLPKSRQVPLLDSHARYSIDSQLGSIRNLTKEQNGVRGTLEFSSTAGDSWTKVREGHVTDVSAGFEVLSETYLAAGEKRSWYGKEFTGPINVATKWRLREGSVVPIGADEAAKMRGYRISGDKLVKEQEHQPARSGGTSQETVKVNPELKARCVAAGMDSTLNDEQAMAWLNANIDRLAKPKQEGGETLAELKRMADSIKEMRDETLRAQAQREQRDAFERDVNSTLELVFGETVPTDIKRDALACKTTEEARAKIAEGKKKLQDENPVGASFGRIEFSEASRDKHRAVMQTALAVRGYETRGFGIAEKLLPETQRVKGWEQFRNAPLLEIARECLIADGFNYRELMGLSRQSLAIAALGWPHKVGLRSMGYAYHMTGSLAFITLDAINKNLTSGYNEAPSTWQGPMRQASSVPDFKNKHVIKLSAAGNLPLWQDNKAPEQTALSNEKESYAVEARALALSFSWQLLVNDDMESLSRGPSLLGASAKRTVNAVAWAQVTSNPTLSDGQALFLASPTGNRKRSNLTTGSATPTNSTLQTMTNKMMQMRGLNTPEGNESSDILNIQPVYIIGPTALRTTILQLVMSSADPAASGNSGIYNPSGGLIPVIEPLLDANSTTAWYLGASPSQVDTVEVSFLQGQETPVLNDYVNEQTLSREITVIQSFAAKAIDHRGLQRHDGA